MMGLVLKKLWQFTTASDSVSEYRIDLCQKTRLNIEINAFFALNKQVEN